VKLNTRPSSAVVKNEYSYGSSSSTCLLGVDMENFTLPYRHQFYINCLKISVICVQRAVRVRTSMSFSVPYDFHKKRGVSPVEY
jgi:hypothetical protein